jgi:hypothetical protein
MKQMEIDKLNLVERLNPPTPSFFIKLRTFGLALAAISGALVASPIVLPAIVTTIAGYMAVAGTVVTAVSQITVKG